MVTLDAAGWRQNIDRLSEVSGISVVDYASFVRALEQRREAFKQLGVFATDHSAVSPRTGRLGEADAAAIFDRALREGAPPFGDAERFTAHMLLEQARPRSRAEWAGSRPGYL